MTPEQLKQNPITVHPNQKPDTDEGECDNTKDEEESITSSEMSEEDCESDTITDDTEGSNLLKMKKSQKELKCNKFIML